MIAWSAFSSRHVGPGSKFTGGSDIRRPTVSLLQPGPNKSAVPFRGSATFRVYLHRSSIKSTIVSLRLNGGRNWGE